MTTPRRVLPHAVSFLTRRCSERRFFLRPSKLTNEIVLYILAVAAQRYGVLVHGYCVLSDHVHAVVSDPNGKLPRFQQYMHALIARSINSLHDHWESFWCPGSYSAVTLIASEDVLGKVAYVLANPVAAGLVRHAREWPGLWSAPEQIGAGPILLSRPDRFFRKKGPMPETVPLELVCPQGFDSVEAFREQLLAEVTRLEDEAAQKLGEEGHSFLGARKVLAQRPDARPTSTEPRRNLNPRIACRDEEKRIDAIRQLKLFLSAYRAAWRQFRDGLREVVFPHGTYGMRVLYAVRCAATG